MLRVSRFVPLTLLLLSGCVPTRPASSPPTPVRAAVSNSPFSAPSSGVAFTERCPKCKRKYEFFARFIPGKGPLPRASAPKVVGVFAYPMEDDVFVCPHCGTAINLAARRAQIERVDGQKFVP